MATPLLCVTNISSYVSPQQVKELMSYMGELSELRVFPESDQYAKDAPSKVAFVRFRESDACSILLHMHDSIMGDRQLRIIKTDLEDIPDEEDALRYAAPAADAIPLSAAVEMMRSQSAAALLPTPPPGILGPAPEVGILTQAGTTIPPPPPLTGNVDPSKIDEIRRTIYCGNLNTSLTADDVMKFFEPCGKINFVRMAGDETQPTRFAFVEFADPKSVTLALSMNGGMLGDRPVKVNHSKNAIVKPQPKTAEAEKRDIEQTLKRVQEAQQLIRSVIEPSPERVTSRRRRSRSYSRSPIRNRSRRSHSKSRGRDRRRRSRSRSYSPRHRSPRRYSSGRRSGGTGSNRRRRHRSRSRSPSKERRRRSRERSHSRSRSRSPTRKHKSKKRRHRSKSKSRSTSPKRRRSRSTSPKRRRSRSTSPKRRRSRSTSPKRRRSRSTSPKRRRSRSTSPKRRRSRSTSPKRRRSRSTSPKRRRSRSTSPKRRIRSKTPPSSAKRRAPSLVESKSSSKSPSRSRSSSP